MPVHLRDGSPCYQIEFEFQGRWFRRSSGTTSKREAQELERRWRGELREQLVFGEPAPMSWGETIDRYFATVIVPKENPRATKRDGYWAVEFDHWSPQVAKRIQALGEEPAGPPGRPCSV